MKKYTNVTSKAKKLEFSGTHYFGLTSNTYGAPNTQGNSGEAGFEFRRNYVQAKAYFNDKDYMRVTLDSTKELGTSTGTLASPNGYANTYIKYMYLWLDNILPYTGVEIGMAHRAWIDYEENDAWFFRSINKVNLEDTPMDVMNSADMGVNFRTSTPYFSSEFALYNGEGYHSDQNNKMNSGMSLEWRTTAHLMGNGEHVGHYHVDKDTYANLSFAGLRSADHKADGTSASARYDRNSWWLHAVYNQPEFLIAAQYNYMKDDYVDNSSDIEKKSWSINGEYRPLHDWTVLARYDSINKEYIAGSANNTNDVGDYTQAIYGVAYQYNKNVKFIASGKTVNYKDQTAAGASSSDTSATLGDLSDKQSWMMTTEVTW
jgi:hypothetical protein